MASNDAAHRAQIAAVSKARAHLTPPTCVDCGEHWKPHPKGGYKGGHGRCETCRRRHSRRQARAELERAALPPLKASDSGYGPYGVVRLGVAS